MKKILLSSLFCLSGLASTAQIPNSGFESWVAVNNDTVPEFWNTSGFGAGRSSVSNTGSYSVYVWNWYYYAKGWIVNGDLNGTFFSQFETYHGGTPLNQKPLRLKGHYLYEPGDNGGFADSAFINVTVKKYNVSLDRPDTVALGRLHLPAASIFTPFEVELADLAPGIDPDSIVISFWSCFDNNCFCNASGLGNCLFFYVDDLLLDFSSGVVPINDWFTHPIVYPNPSANEIKIRIPQTGSEIVELQLLNSLGEVVRQEEALVITDILWKKDKLKQGVYYLTIKSGESIFSCEKVVFY